MTIDQSTQPRNKWIICSSTSTEGRRRARRKDRLVPAASTNYNDLNSVGFALISTTDEILNDPIWRRRILASLEQARRGQTRPIEEYLAESDADDR
jgi:hypothetical protein